MRLSKRFSSNLRYFAPALMLEQGSNSCSLLLMPNSLAVSGHLICIKPTASELDTALGFRLLSTLATDAKKLGLILYCFPARSKQVLYGYSISFFCSSALAQRQKESTKANRIRICKLETRCLNYPTLTNSRHEVKAATEKCQISDISPVETVPAL